MSPYPIEDKFKAFKWNVLTIDGHDYAQIADAIDKAKETKGAPTVIVAKTVKRKRCFLHGKQCKIPWKHTDTGTV